jgi:hypothetical protein
MAVAACLRGDGPSSAGVGVTAREAPPRRGDGPRWRTIMGRLQTATRPGPIMAVPSGTTPPYARSDGSLVLASTLSGNVFDISPCRLRHHAGPSVEGSALLEGLAGEAVS